MRQKILAPLEDLKARGKISGKTDVEIEISTVETSHRDLEEYCLSHLGLGQASLEFDDQTCSITLDPHALELLGIVELG